MDLKKIINQIEARGNKPSAERTQLFAAYLGVTTSQLLGAEEIKKERPTPNAGSEPSDGELIRLWKNLSPEDVPISVFKLNAWRRNKRMRTVCDKYLYVGFKPFDRDVDLKIYCSAPGQNEALEQAIQRRSISQPDT